MNVSDKKIKAKSWQLFDRIAYRYDILNRILSLGIDVYWRKKIIPHIPVQPHIKLLDLATGTGDVLFTLSKSKLHSFDELLGMDLSENMMSYGREKKKNIAQNYRYDLQMAMQHVYPFQQTHLML